MLLRDSMAQLQHDMADFKRDQAESRTKFEDKLDDQFETREANLKSRYRRSIFFQFLFALLAAVVALVAAKRLPFWEMPRAVPEIQSTELLVQDLKPSIDNNDAPPID